MWANELTLQELESRQQRLHIEKREDQTALINGQLDTVEATERSVLRDFEERWLEMEALLLKSKPLVAQ